MKYKFLLTFLVCITLDSVGQNDSSNVLTKELIQAIQTVDIDNKNDSFCQTGYTSAKKDIKKGVFKQYTFGSGIDIAYEYVLNTDYSIETENVGCSATSFHKCYNDKMNEVIYLKYENNIYKKANTESESLDIIPVEYLK